MADVLTPEQRKGCMAAIKHKNTKPEMIVRKVVHSMGYRYRLHSRKLPGKPDLVFHKLKKLIFVNGCFWHRHNCQYGRVQPKTNYSFWKTKIDSNVLRDAKSRRNLKKQGWYILTVWECQTKQVEKLAKRIHRFLIKKMASILMNGLA